MKNLTYKEYLEAPSRVQFIYNMAMAKQPIGSSMLEKAIEENPEYFPDILEHRRKWSLVPQSVQDEYTKQREILRSEIYKEMPPSKGILGWIEDQKGYEDWSKKYDECRKKEEPLEKALHDKFYKQYGIEWNGW